MDAIRASSSMAECECRDADRMVKIELEAAEALAGLAHFPANMSESPGSESIAERVKDESNDGNSSFDTFPKCSNNSYEDATNCMPMKSSILTAKSVKDEQSTELGLNPTYPTNSASSGRKSRRNLTEAEMEARKIRRVLANRESARQTIRRRQAIFEELSRKAVDLAWENENLKREKDTASKQHDSLKSMNECLKAQMIKIMKKVEAEETREESVTMNEPTISTSSTNSPFIIYNQPPFLPFVWPSMIQPTNSVQLQCGPPARIVFPSHIPISAANKPDSSSCEDGNSMMINGAGSPLYLLPYPWLFTLPQNGNEHRPHSFNLNDKPKESSECQQFFPDKVKAETSLFKEPTPSNDVHGRNHTGFPPDGGGQQTTELNPQVAMPAPVSCEALIEHDDTNTFLTEHLKATTVGDSKQIVGEIHQVPVVCSGKRLGDMAAAAEARKRRKHLTRLKNQLHCRQLRMH